MCQCRSWESRRHNELLVTVSRDRQRSRRVRAPDEYALLVHVPSVRLRRIRAVRHAHPRHPALHCRRPVALRMIGLALGFELGLKLILRFDLGLGFGLQQNQETSSDPSHPCGI